MEAPPADAQPEAAAVKTEHPLTAPPPPSPHPPLRLLIRTNERQIEVLSVPSVSDLTDEESAELEGDEREAVVLQNSVSQNSEN